MLDTKGFGRCSFSGLTHSLGLAADRCALSASLSCIMGSVKKANVTTGSRELLYSRVCMILYGVHVLVRGLGHWPAPCCLPIVTALSYKRRVSLQYAYRPKGCEKQVINFAFPLFCSFRLFVFLPTRRYFFPKLHVGSTLSVWLGQSRIFISSSLLRHPNSKLSSPDPSSASPLNTAPISRPPRTYDIHDRGTCEVRDMQ